MKIARYLLCTSLACIVSVQAMAAETKASKEAAKAPAAAPEAKTFSTGVAKGRDLLDPRPSPPA